MNTRTFLRERVMSYALPSPDNYDEGRMMEDMEGGKRDE
jgi:hypothetical protein